MTVSGSPHHQLPVARRSDLVVSAAAADVLAYDQLAHHIHHLNPVAAAVWRACDGTHDVEDLASRASATTNEAVTEASIHLALAQLDDANLLEHPLAPELTSTRETRRSLLRKAGLAAVPAIISVSAPSAAVAQSNCVPLGEYGACEGEGQCCIRGDGNGCCVYLGSDLGWGCVAESNCVR